jgi:hypothetical protein
MIRDRTFFEVDWDNKKLPNGNKRISEVEGVLSMQDGKFQVVPTSTFLEKAQNENFWSA